MCGGDASIRIERADNGYTIDAYTPGGENRPGKHSRMVASDPEQVMKLTRPHLVKIGKKKGRRGEAVQMKAGGKRKKAARKKA